MKLKLFSLAGLIAFILVGCSKPIFSESITGTWEITSEYRNDYYGGPFFWKTIPETERVQVEFTPGGKYYRSEKRGGSMKLIGSYTKLSEGLKIQPVDQTEPHYFLQYKFDENKNLLITTGQTEGVVEEKLRRIIK